MEFTFVYDVVTTTTNVQIASVSFKEELSEDQVTRMAVSYYKKKFKYLDEDESLADIYDYIYDVANQFERQSEYGDLVGTEVMVTNVGYPSDIEEVLESAVIVKELKEQL